jgi:hypothetical protein
MESQARSSPISRSTMMSLSYSCEGSQTHLSDSVSTFRSQRMARKIKLSRFRVHAFVNLAGS